MYFSPQQIILLLIVFDSRRESSTVTNKHQTLTLASGPVFLFSRHGRQGIMEALSRSVSHRSLKALTSAMSILRPPGSHHDDDDPPHDTSATPSDEMSNSECDDDYTLDRGHELQEAGSSSTPTSSGQPSSTMKDPRVDPIRNQLAANETRAVRRLKCIVFSCLFVSMMAVAFTAYFLTAKQENDEFEDQYYEDANKC